MANRQIHELPAASGLLPEDQLLVSQAGSNATRRASLALLPFQPALPILVDGEHRLGRGPIAAVVEKDNIRVQQEQIAHNSSNPL